MPILNWKLAYSELHFHLLPGIDDGPRTVHAALELAAAAVADGTGTVLATPHVRPGWVTDPQCVHDATLELRGELRRAGIDLEVVAGGELGHEIVERLSDRQLDAVAHGPQGRRWVLLEGPFEGYGPDLTAATDELRARGFAVLLAHPERTRQTTGTVAAIRHELAAGTVLQVTAASVTGDFGEPARELALRYLRSAPRVLLASDAHGPQRMPSLRAAVGALAEAGFPDPGRFAGALPHALLERGLPRAPGSLAA